HRPFLAALLCSVMLILCAGEAHLHQCFDGREAPVALHLIDVGLEHPPGTEAEHHDRNVMLGAGEAFKPSSLDFDLPPALLAALIALILAATVHVVRISGVPAALPRPVLRL